MCSGTCNVCKSCQDTCSCNTVDYDTGCIDKLDADCVIYNFDANSSASKLLCFLGVQNGTSLKTILEKLDTRMCNATSGMFDEKVKVTIDDTTEGYLFDKLVTTNCLTKNLLTVDGVQTLQLGVDLVCLKNALYNTPTSCFLPIYGEPILVCNGSVTNVQVSTVNTGSNIVQFSIDEGVTWVDGIPNHYSFVFPSNGTLQKVKARIKGCTIYADGYVRLCTVVSPPVTPITPTPVPAPTPVTPTAPVFFPVTPPTTPTTPIAPTPVAPSPTPVVTPTTCVPVTSFDYTINGNLNANGFTITGVQDVNVVVTGYSPSGASTPIFYEYILDTVSTGIISSNSKNYPSVNVGNHVLTVIVYNCSGSVTRNINFTINSAPTPVAPSPVPTAPSPTPVPVTPTPTPVPVTPTAPSPTPTTPVAPTPVAPTPVATCYLICLTNEDSVSHTARYKNSTGIVSTISIASGTTSCIVSNSNNVDYVVYDTTSNNNWDGGTFTTLTYTNTSCSTTPTSPVSTPVSPPTSPAPSGFNGYQYDVVKCSDSTVSTIVASVNTLVIGSVYSLSTGNGDIKECYTVTSSYTGTVTTGAVYNLISECGNTQRCVQL